MSDPAVSLVISSFNYQAFLPEAIDSALAQREVEAEVIVVDDGSTDHSPEIIASYGQRVVPVLKENGGQASAINAGFARSSGRSVMFLDSDDVLLPGAAGAIADALGDADVAKAHWSMPIVDENTRRTGALQDRDLAEGDLREFVLRDGPLSDATMPSPDMSGNAFPRWFLEQITPIPVGTYRTMADEYLFGLAPAFGRIVRLEPQSLKRAHATNALGSWSFERMLAFQTEHYEIVARVVSHELQQHGIEPDADAWRRSSWWLRTGRVAAAIEQEAAPGTRTVLVDQGSLGIGSELRGRIVMSFPDADGEFAGTPADDDEALSELRRIESEVDYVAIAWPAFWWLEEYPRWASALRSAYRVLRDDLDVMILERRSDDRR